MADPKRANNGQWIRPKNPDKSAQVWLYGKLAGLLALLLFLWGLTEYVAIAFSRDGSLPQSPWFTIFGYGVFNPLLIGPWEVRFIKWTIAGGSNAGIALRWAAGGLILGSLIVYRLVFGPVTALLVRSYMKNTQDVYGSSKFAEKKDIIEAELLPRDEKSLKGGVVLGAWRDPKDPTVALVLRDRSDRHVINIASTRSGKTSGVVIPTALEWDASMVVTDMKGELYDKTAGWRQKNGHKIIRFAPMEPDKSSHLNPLDSVRLETKYEIGDAQKLADWLCHPGGEKETDSHWNETAQQLVAGVILYELYKCKIRYNRTATMADIAYGLGPYARNADTGDIEALPFEGYLRNAIGFEIDPNYQRGWRLRDGSPTKCHPFILQTLTVALQRASREAASVLSSASKRFFVYSDPMVAEVTGSSDFAPEDLVRGENPVSFYLVIPPSERDRLGPLIRVIASWVVSRLTEKEGQWKHELLMLLDEFPSLGYVKPIESALSYTASYGIRFFLICQDLGQIKKLYSTENEILPNCQLKLLFTPGELDTAKTISDSIGATTVEHASVSLNDQKIIPDGKNMSVQRQQHHRMLLEASELMKLKLPTKRGRTVTAPGELILLVHGFPPVFGVQTMWFLNEQWRRQVGLPATLEKIEKKKSIREEMEESLKGEPDKPLRDWANEVAEIAAQGAGQRQ